MASDSGWSKIIVMLLVVKDKELLATSIDTVDMMKTPVTVSVVVSSPLLHTTLIQSIFQKKKP